MFFNDNPINFTDTYTYLGTILDSNLVQSTDFDSKYKKASKKLGVLRKLMELLTTEAAHLVYDSIIVSALMYCQLEFKFVPAVEVETPPKKSGIFI